MSNPAPAPYAQPGFALPADIGPVESDPILVRIREAGPGALKAAEELAVLDGPTKIIAADLVARARKTIRLGESRRKVIVGPLNDQVKAINKVFADALSLFKRVDELAAGKILEFNRAEARRAAEKAAEAERERLRSDALFQEAAKAEAAGEGAVAEKLLDGAVAGEAAAADAQSHAVLPERVTPTGTGTVGTRKKPWTFRVVDADAVPRAYLSVDHAKVKAAIAVGEREIPGLEIFQDEGLQVR